MQVAAFSARVIFGLQAKEPLQKAGVPALQGCIAIFRLYKQLENVEKCCRDEAFTKLRK